MTNFHPKPILSPKEYITTGQAIGDLINHPVDPAFNHVPTIHREDMARRIMETPEGKSLYKGYSDAWKNVLGMRHRVQSRKTMGESIFIQNFHVY